MPEESQNKDEIEIPQKPKDSSGKTESTKITEVRKRDGEYFQGGDACLVMIYGDDLGKRYPLRVGGTTTLGKGVHPDYHEVVVGRSVQCDIRLNEESVSRKHAAFIIHREGSVSVRDMGSTNGTHINDVLLLEKRLYDGDFVKIGRSIFKFLSSHNVEAQYHEEIYRLTTVDGLTGAFNKRYFLENLDREIGRAVRYGRPLSLIMLDIDYFKKINDTYGHLAGDTILKQIASLILQHTRKEDIFARYGGEEFGLVLPEMEEAGATRLAEKLRQQIEEGRFLFENNPVPITMSMGVAVFEGVESKTRAAQEMSLTALIQAADTALYEAKKTGRNRVCVYQFAKTQAA